MKEAARGRRAPPGVKLALRLVRGVACAAVVAAAIVARATYFDRWHDVARADWSEAFCWAPDCQRPPGTAPDAPVYKPCTGFDHHHQSDLPLVALPAIAALAAVAGVTWRRAASFALGLFAACLFFVMWSFQTTLLAHLFDRFTEPSAAERAFHGAEKAMLAGALLALVMAVAVWRLDARKTAVNDAPKGDAPDDASKTDTSTS